MTENPYQPSLVPPWTPPVQERRGISVLAIFLGALTDIGGTIVLGIVLSVVFTIYLLQQGVPLEGLADEMDSPLFYFIELVPGLGLTLLGGFVAGRVAKQRELLHGGISGSISAIIVLLLQLMQGAQWYAFAATAAVPPLAMLGATLSMTGRRRQQVANKIS